jgi:hypothetical protein
MSQQAHFAVRLSEPSNVSCRCVKLHKQPNGQARKAATARRARDNGSYVPQPLDFPSSITAPANVVRMAVIRPGDASRPGYSASGYPNLAQLPLAHSSQAWQRCCNTTEPHRAARDALLVLRPLRLSPIDMSGVGHHRQGASLCNSALRA